MYNSIFFRTFAPQFMNVHALYIILFPVLLLSGCNLFQRPRAGAAVELDGQYIYYADIDSLTRGMSPEDSSRFIDSYIRQWAGEILLYREAKSSTNARIEQLVENYRRSLYVLEYEQHYADRHMSSFVADSLIQQFYEQHAEQLVLSQSIVRGLMLILPSEATGRKELNKWLEAPEDNLENIEKYAYANATGYELFTDRWMTVNQILMRMPSENEGLQAQLQTRNRIEVSDSVSTCILCVTDKALAGHVMPLSYARPEIEKIILSQRRILYQQKQRDELYKEAVRFNTIKFYDE